MIIIVSIILYLSLPISILTNTWDMSRTWGSIPPDGAAQMLRWLATLSYRSLADHVSKYIGDRELIEPFSTEEAPREAVFAVSLWSISIIPKYWTTTLLVFIIIKYLVGRYLQSTVHFFYPFCIPGLHGRVIVRFSREQRLICEKKCCLQFARTLRWCEAPNMRISVEISVLTNYSTIIATSKNWIEYPRTLFNFCLLVFNASTRQSNLQHVARREIVFKCCCCPHRRNGCP